jgi:cysteinyl-tRNA synthetase
MDDDFNTPGGLAAFQGLKTDINKLLSQGLSTEARKSARQAFRTIGDVLGLFQMDKWQFNPVAPFVGMNLGSEMTRQKNKWNEKYDTSISPPPLPLRVADDQQVQQKVDERNEARMRKDFKRADEIKAELKVLGIIIEDKPDGTSRWKR